MTMQLCSIPTLGTLPRLPKLLLGWGLVLTVVAGGVGCRGPSRGTRQHPAPPAPLLCPLDGQPTSTAALARRPLAVLIENSPRARPQSGLTQACVVYEAITEGGITRFLAVFYHQDPPVIGPVRSVRPHFLYWAREYDAALVHCGQSYEALQILVTGMDPYNLDQLKYARPFWRDRSRRAPHNLYTAADRLRRFLQAQHWEGRSTTLPTWGPSNRQLPPPRVTVRGVALTFGGKVRYQVRWEYDAARNGYVRFMDGRPHLDRETGQPIVAANILIQRVWSAQLATSAQGTFDVRVTGEGHGQALTHGGVLPLKWTKADLWRVTHFTAERGGALPLTPGQTWVEVVPLTGTVTLLEKDAPAP
jgi:hypothetical protein